MKKELDKLWYSYLIELSPKYDDDEKIIIKKYKDCENKFRSLLNGEQEEAFEEYDKALNEINSISEKRAFIRGVMFSTRFLFEALYEE